MPKKNDLKVEGKQVLWWNGEKWLVKEFLRTTALAKEKHKELTERNGK